MNKQKLIKVLQDNNVSFNSQLLNESVVGYANDENAVYAKRLYADLYLMAQYGIQNGFGKVSGAIKKISDFIAQLLNGTKYEIVNLTKMETQRQKILSGLGDLNGGINMNMKEELLKNLEDCIAVSDAIVSFRGDNAKLCEKLTESKAILEQLRTELDNVVDVLSVDAGNFQAAIFDILMDWRKAVSNYNCYSDNVQSLRQAISIAKDWGKLTQTVSRFNRAKEERDYYLYSPDYDDICGIIKAAPFAERTEGLRTAVTAYRENTAYLCDVESLKAKKQDLEDKLKSEEERIQRILQDLSNEYDQTVVAFQNGALDATTADRRCSDCEEEYARYEEELKDIKQDYSERISEIHDEIYQAGVDSRVREQLAGEFERVINMLERYRNTDPAKFVLLCSRVDFETMHDTLTGRASDNSRNELFTNIQAITNVVDQEVNEQRKVAAELTDIRKKAKQESHAQLTLQKEKEAKRKAEQAVSHVGRIGTAQSNEEASVKNMEARLKAGKLGGIKPPVGQNTNTNPDGTIPVGNDDK